MEKVIIIKYGELNTKKDNINYFIKALRNDLSKKIDNDVEYDHGRMIIFGDDLDIVTLMKEGEPNIQRIRG